jgi:hypothetical protein
MPRLIAVESGDPGDSGDSRGAEKRVSNIRFLPTLRQLHVYVKCEIYSACTILSESHNGLIGGLITCDSPQLK